MPGVAEYMQQGGLLVPVPPSAVDCAPGTSVAAPGGSSALPLVGLAAVGIAAYFIFR